LAAAIAVATAHPCHNATVAPKATVNARPPQGGCSTRRGGR